jgi:hypothetical protein
MHEIVPDPNPPRRGRAAPIDVACGSRMIAAPPRIWMRASDSTLHRNAIRGGAAGSTFDQRNSFGAALPQRGGLFHPRSGLSTSEKRSRSNKMEKRAQIFISCCGQCLICSLSVSAYIVRGCVFPWRFADAEVQAMPTPIILKLSGGTEFGWNRFGLKTSMIVNPKNAMKHPKLTAIHCKALTIRM